MNRLLRLACLLLMALPLAACPDGYVVNTPMGDILGDVEPPDARTIETAIQVPDGFEIALFATVPRAREVLPTPTGDLIVSVPNEGTVVRLGRDANGDGAPDSTTVLLAELAGPNGIDLHDGWLYVAEQSEIGRIRYDVETGKTSGTLETVLPGLPEGGNHWRRTVRIGPDGFLYATIGSSCNVCDEKEPWRAKMLRARADGSDVEVFARGLRNAADFDWHPGTGELYATDNGRDLLGDDYPPCELNHVVRGGDYGWPVANANRDPDPDFGEGQEARIQASLPPVHDFPPHNAPLGIDFLEHPSQPAGYRHAAIVALHGSWNRSLKDGYKVVSLHFEADGSVTSRDFVWGFLEEDDVIGRPVDAREGPDGSIYVSDDYTGAIYRVRPTGS